MFDLHSTEKLVEWKRIRDQIEKSNTPLQDVVDLWSKAPFVSNYLNPFNAKEWPDPWHLILDGKFDDLAICLGMLYTLQLTQRFMSNNYEIHMSITPETKDPAFYLCVDRLFVLNYSYKEVVDYKSSMLKDTTLLFVTKK